MRKLTGIVERVVTGSQAHLIQAQKRGGGEGARAASGVVAGGPAQPGLKGRLGDVGLCKIVKPKQWSMEMGSRTETEDQAFQPLRR